MAVRQPLNFNDFIFRLSNALGLEQGQQQILVQVLQPFTDAQRYRLIQNVNQHVQTLVQADNQLRALIEQGGALHPFRQNIQQNWNDMNNQLVQLQLLSLIQRNQNCDEIIRALLDALNNKIRSVNQILRENLDPAGAHHAANQGGGANDDKYMSKYLKYKNKYLSLKKMI